MNLELLLWVMANGGNPHPFEDREGMAPGNFWPPDGWIITISAGGGIRLLGGIAAVEFAKVLRTC
jgi:hypothetical protein